MFADYLCSAQETKDVTERGFSDKVRTKINEILHGDYLEELIKLLAGKLNISQ